MSAECKVLIPVEMSIILDTLQFVIYVVWGDAANLSREIADDLGKSYSMSTYVEYVSIAVACTDDQPYGHFFPLRSTDQAVTWNFAPLQGCTVWKECRNENQLKKTYYNGRTTRNSQGDKYVKIEMTWHGS